MSARKCTHRKTTIAVAIALHMGLITGNLVDSDPSGERVRFKEYSKGMSNHLRTDKGIQVTGSSTLLLMLLFVLLKGRIGMGLLQELSITLYWKVRLFTAT